jgi:hypothetical protein
LCGCKFLGPSFAALSATHAAERYGVRVSGINWLFYWGTIHVLAYGLFHNATGYFHEVALAA